MLKPASRSWRRWGMPRMDPVPTAPAPPTWNVLLAEMPPTESERSARRKCSGSDGRGRPGRPQKGGAHSDSHVSPSRAASCHMSSTLAAGPCAAGTTRGTRTRSPARRPGRPEYCARRATRSSDHLLAGAAVAQRNELTVDDVGQPDPCRCTLGRSGPIDGDDLHHGCHRDSAAASAQSLVTVFQFRVVLTTPSRRSSMAPLSLEFP